MLYLTFLAVTEDLNDSKTNVFVGPFVVNVVNHFTEDLNDSKTNVFVVIHVLRYDHLDCYI